MLRIERESHPNNGFSGESAERVSPEMILPMSSPYGREALAHAGQLDPAVRRIGDDLMLRSGGLDFTNVMPREGTLDFLRDPVANAEAQAIQQMAAQWRAEHPGEPLPKELAKLLRGLNPQDGGVLDVGAGDADGGGDAGGGGGGGGGGGDGGGDGGGGGGGGGGGRRRRRRRRSGGSRRRGGDSSRRRGRSGGDEENNGADDEENPSGSQSRPNREGGRRRSADGGDEAPAGRRANRGGRESGDPRSGRESGDPRSGRESGDPRSGRDVEGDRRGTEDARPTELRGGTRAEKIFNFLTNDLNLTRAQAAGVLGNFIQESAQLDPKQPGDGGNAIGIAQWNGPRKRALFAFARENGASATELDTQLKFLKHELHTTERGAFNALKRTSTPEQAALTFSRLFERPGNPMNGNRVANARMAFNRYGRSDEVQVASR